ncbi:MAG: DUF393 domain-containing protein [Bacteroidetes bacterium]|nr:DUF393 domain-containing protein [Bacteroidota bacterium]
MGATHEVEKLIFFDGVCGLCNAWVQFVIHRNKKKSLFFTPLQSDYSKNLLQQVQVETNVQTIIYFKKGKLFFKSDAVLEIARELRGLWPLFFVLKVIPRFFRDYIYDKVATHRYKWFGKLPECRLPTPDLKDRFL